jgi:antitoxin (DNA-binding transcriptional repressor) of toxin-antitoxin stability system
MTNVNVQEAAASFPRLLAAVEGTGETILICREGQPVAELRPLSPRANVDRLRTHPDLKPLWVAPDFDPAAAASEDEWPEECR